jgi:nicotinate-nucleotide pyrophosphorylase (carboxylating)
MDIALNPRVRSIIDAALAEDLANGDLTSDLLLPPTAQAKGRVVARQKMIVAGATIFEQVMNRTDPYISVSLKVPDGTKVQPDEEIASVAGKASSILAAERTALNFIMRLSGIATLTRSYVKAVPEGSKTRIIDTRKTTPGLRLLEKYAVRCGGGGNHRSDLGGGILIKDNHIAAVGSIAKAVAAAKSCRNPAHRVEVEVSTLAEVDEAVASGADTIMLDNMSPSDIAMAVQRISGRAIVEVSGGVTLADVARIAGAGIDFISVGSLTHSAAACDVSLEFTPQQDG